MAQYCPGQLSSFGQILFGVLDLARAMWGRFWPGQLRFMDYQVLDCKLDLCPWKDAGEPELLGMVLYLGFHVRLKLIS